MMKTCVPLPLHAIGGPSIVLLRESKSVMDQVLGRMQGEVYVCTCIYVYILRVKNTSGRSQHTSDRSFFKNRRGPLSAVRMATNCGTEHAAICTGGH